MADFEANVPQQIEHLPHDLQGVRRDLLPAVAVQEHHIDVAARIEFAPAIAAQRKDCERGRVRARLRDGRRCRPRQNVAQQYIDHFRAAARKSPGHRRSA